LAEGEQNTPLQHGEPFRNSAFRRIELSWPGKDQDLVPHQDTNGEWILEPSSEVRSLAPLVNLHKYPETWNGPSSLVLSGDRLEALNTLARGFPGGIKLAYLDTPRLEVDDKTAAFKGDATYTFSTWMTVLQVHLRALKPLLSHTGVVVVHTGDLEEPYARLLLDEEFDRDNRIATIVWQRAYGPRNMKGMKEFTATHDCLLVYALRKSALPAVGLRTAPDGFSNSDDDPRKEWKAEHKGAHSYRAKSDFETHISPYHWTIAKGRLPRGLWRLNPLTGVIWGYPEEHGDFPLTIEASDTNGKTVRKNFTLKCANTGTPPPIPSSVPWLFQRFETKGELRITTTSLPDAVVGQEYTVMVFAAGGSPFTAPPKRPGSGRYWEFADDTLVAAYHRDAVYLGKDGKSIPHPKTYAEEVGDTVIKNQMTWWPGRTREGNSSIVLAGYTEDATKHLKKLLEIGVIHKVVNTAKPEHLLSRLLDILTEPGDIALEVFGDAADLSAVALKTGRRFVYLSGESERGGELLNDCALPRLRAVVDGRDNELERHEGEIRMRSDAYLPFAGGGGFFAGEIGQWLFRRKVREDMPRLNHAYNDFSALRDAVLTAQGFFPRNQGAFPDGQAFFENGAAVVIPPDEFLDVGRAAEIASTLKPQYDRVTIFYFRSAEEFSPSSLMEGVICRRVPTEIVL
jgi:hypothetical protein